VALTLRHQRASVRFTFRRKNLTDTEGRARRDAEKTTRSARYAAAANNIAQSVQASLRDPAKPSPAPAGAATGKCGKRSQVRRCAGGIGFRRPRSTTAPRRQESLRTVATSSVGPSRQPVSFEFSKSLTLFPAFYGRLQQILRFRPSLSLTRQPSFRTSPGALKASRKNARRDGFAFHFRFHEDSYRLRYTLQTEFRSQPSPSSNGSPCHSQ
jgi:hypothetical protein